MSNRSIECLRHVELEATLRLALEALEPRPGMPNPEYESLTRCVVTALKEALAHKAVAPQEPVAEIHSSTLRWIALEDNRPTNALLYTIPYAATPRPQRTWVGLTIEDKKEYIAQDFGGNRLDAMDWAEERLKEKNNGTR